MGVVTGAVGYRLSSDRLQDSARHEYEVLVGENRWFFVGKREVTAVAEAAAVARDSGVDRVRLYHTYPSPGPTRRFMGEVHADGVFHDARY